MDNVCIYSCAIFTVHHKHVHYYSVFMQCNNYPDIKPVPKNFLSTRVSNPISSRDESTRSISDALPRDRGLTERDSIEHRDRRDEQNKIRDRRDSYDRNNNRNRHDRSLSPRIRSPIHSTRHSVPELSLAERLRLRTQKDLSHADVTVSGQRNSLVCEGGVALIR